MDDVVAALKTNADHGLTATEAHSRLERVGPNDLAPEAPTPAWRKFLAQFQDVLVILLILAAAISGGLWVYERESPLPYEALAIIAVVLINAILSYVQESRAESAVAALRQMSAAKAHVVRDGRPLTIPSSQVVPGDIILVEEGDTIPADARVISTTALKTADAALTGESLPVAKQVEAIATDAGPGDQLNMLFSGTAAIYGRGRAVVVATGMSTEMGRIAGMLRNVPHDTTPLQKELDRVGKMLGAVVVEIAIVMIATIVMVQNVRGLSALFDVLILGVALAVAAVPEGLPAIVTAVLAIGVQRMARRKAIVRHLRAVETLGAADVIASDKTGTLTRNEMTVRAVLTASGRVGFEGSGYAPQGVVTAQGGGDIPPVLRTELDRALEIADRANNAALQEIDGRWTIHGDPTEAALVVAARKVGLQSTTLQARLPRVGELPFSSDRKMMSTLHADAGSSSHSWLFTKGAPDVLLGRCTAEYHAGSTRPLDDSRRTEILRLNDALAGEALRTLAVAYRHVPAGTLSADDMGEDVERDLVFAGLIGMIDPPREEAREAVATATRAGIRTMMITGDHPCTARVIAADLGIAAPGDRVVSGSEIEQMSDVALNDAVASVSVFARVNPEHKLRIVRALQARGAVVAMTGDGVNDAPALKMADIGLAMGVTGTDVSKQAADIILVDDNFASIVAAVEEGRAIFSNIRKFLRYLLSSNIGEVMTMFFGVLLAGVIGLQGDENGFVLPLLATQLLWINLVTDGAPALALGIDPTEPGLMRRPPRSKHEGVITMRMWGGIALVGVVMAAGTLFVLDASLPAGLVAGTGTLRHAQTMAFTTLMLFQLFNVFNARSDRASAFSGLFTNGWVWAGVGLSLLLHTAVIYAPVLQQAFSTVALTLPDWLFCAGVASSVLWLRELEKVIRRVWT